MPHVSFHIIQSFAPNNLNRDDTGAPKDCVFGGVRRARVSSQAWKRAVRVALRAEQDLNGHRATRTKRIAELVEKDLRSAHGLDGEEAGTLADAVLDALGLGRHKTSERESAVLVLVTDAEVAALVEWAVANREAILQHRPSAVLDGGDQEEQAAAVSSRGRKKKADKPANQEWARLCAEARSLLTSPRAVDTALFGRMIAEIDDANHEAAAGVAHAISTHEARMEEDYFTAVDDVKQVAADTDQGSGMIGEILYQSAVLYRYATVDAGQLVEGLAGDRELARTALECFTRAFTTAIPTGKQATFAAHNPPSGVMVTVDGQPISLANAFLGPIARRAGARLDAQSWEALLTEWDAIAVFTGSTRCHAVAALPSMGDMTPDGAVRCTLRDLPAVVGGLVAELAAAEPA